MSTRRYAGRARCARGLLGALLVCVALTTACGGARAQTAVAQPLDVPVPPAREVEVSNPATPTPVSLPEEPARTAPSSVLATPVRGVEPARPVEAPRVDPVTEAVKPPAEDASKAPTTTLQTTPAQLEGELERKIRGLLSQANTGLNRINYQALNADGRTQYEAAKRFISQGEEAVKDKNLVFAFNLADKAASLAAQLSGR